MNKNKGIVLYLHVHQPWRIREYSIFDVAWKHNYFSGGQNPDQDNQKIFQKVAEKSYLPMNALLEKLLKKYPDFKISLSFSGTFLEQAERFNPEVLESFKRLVKTGQVEILSSPYHHSLAFFYSRKEFERQVELHRWKIREIFGAETRVLANTELAYSDDLAKWAEQDGFKGVLAEGWDPILNWRSPNYVYRPRGTKKIGLLLKNYRLSDDLAFRFSDRKWNEWPLTADKFNTWVEDSVRYAPLLNLFMDYETFGEHQWAESGIFSFFESLVSNWLQNPNHSFKTVTEAAKNEPIAEISMPQTVTWADTERDLTAWLGNSMQQEAIRYLYALKPRVYNSHDGNLVEDWRRLTTSDHPYYMCTKYFNDGDVHAYFSPYKSPYDAFLYFMDALRDMDFRLKDISPLELQKVQKTQKILQKTLSKTQKITKRKKIFAKMLHQNLMFTKRKRG